MKKIFIIWMLVMLGFSSVSQDKTGYQTKLESLFELSGTEETFKVAINQTMGMFKQQYANVPMEVWDKVETRFLKTSLGELTTMLVPVYEKHLSESDLDEIIQFYESPVGQKYALKTHMIMQESMQVGQTWGMKIGEQLTKELEAEGY